MPHVSKHKIEEKILTEMFTQLIALQSNLKKKAMNDLLDSLLTPTEKVMFAKRCAAILMLHQGCSNYKIWNVLKLSPSTVARLQLAYDSGLHEGITTVFDTKIQEKEKFWNMIELLSRGGLPSMGKDRWTSLKKL